MDVESNFKLMIAAFRQMEGEPRDIASLLNIALKNTKWGTYQKHGITLDALRRVRDNRAKNPKGNYWFKGIEAAHVHQKANWTLGERGRFNLVCIISLFGYGPVWPELSHLRCLLSLASLLLQFLKHGLLLSAPAFPYRLVGSHFSLMYPVPQNCIRHFSTSLFCPYTASLPSSY